MALSVPLASRARARAPRSVFSDRRTGRKLLTAFVLARTSLSVLAGRAAVNAACGGDDRHRVEPWYEVGRRPYVVLAGSTDAVTGQRCFLVIAQGDDLAAFVAAPKAVTDDVDTASTRTDDAPGRQASPTVLPQKEGTAVRDHIGSLDPPRQAAEGRLLSVRRAGSAAAPQTMSSTLVVAGLIGLLGASGVAASIVHSVTGPVRRAMRVLQASEKGRRSHRLRPTTPHGLRHVSRAVDTAGYGAIAPDMTAAGHVVARTVAVVRTTGPVDVSVVEEANLVALDATSGSARSRGADTGFAVIAPRGEEPAEVAAKAAEAVTAVSTPAASSVATTRYAAARSRALGPTTVLWHAVKLDRLAGAIGGACETTVCGSLVRVSTEQRWPVPARDVCPACSTLAH